MKRYDGSIAVVTGASSGIGRRIALDLAARGAVVVGMARREDLLARLEEELRATSPESGASVCDVSDTDAFRDELACIEREHGRIDVLVNNAGIGGTTPIVGTEAAGLDRYRQMMETNYFATVAGTLAVMPGMVRRQAGIVVNVSSDSARAPEPTESAYCATKAAVSAFSESVAHEVAPHGVKVHLLYPAWVPTAMGMAGVEERGASLPPKPVRRTEQQVSELLLERMGGERMEINAAWLPLLAPIGRTLAPRAYQRGMRKFAHTH